VSEYEKKRKAATYIDKLLAPYKEGKKTVEAPKQPRPKFRDMAAKTHKRTNKELGLSDTSVEELFDKEKGEKEAEDNLKSLETLKNEAFKKARQILKNTKIFSTGESFKDYLLKHRRDYAGCEGSFRRCLKFAELTEELE